MKKFNHILLYVLVILGLFVACSAVFYLNRIRDHVTYLMVELDKEIGHDTMLTIIIGDRSLIDFLKDLYIATSIYKYTTIAFLVCMFAIGLIYSYCLYRKKHKKQNNL